MEGPCDGLVFLSSYCDICAKGIFFNTVMGQMTNINLLQTKKIKLRSFFLLLLISKITSIMDTLLMPVMGPPDKADLTCNMDMWSNLCQTSQCM